MEQRSLDDAEVLAAVARLVPQALTELYRRYGRLVHTLVAQIVADVDVAEEVTQDVFERAWRKADSYRPELGTVRTWLTSIARNRAIDVLRSGKTAGWSGPAMDWADQAVDHPHTAGPELAVEQRAEQHRVREAVAALPVEHRQAIALAFFHGLSHRQIAERLQRPLGTVKTHIRSAMQRLRQSLGAERGVAAAAAPRAPGAGAIDGTGAGARRLDGSQPAGGADRSNVVDERASEDGTGARAGRLARGHSGHSGHSGRGGEQ